MNEADTCRTYGREAAAGGVPGRFAGTGLRAAGAAGRDGEGAVPAGCYAIRVDAVHFGSGFQGRVVNCAPRLAAILRAALARKRCSRCLPYLFWGPLRSPGRSPRGEVPGDLPGAAGVGPHQISFIQCLDRLFPD
jgi:hypothetical protein